MLRGWAWPLVGSAGRSTTYLRRGRRTHVLALGPSCSHRRFGGGAASVRGGSLFARARLSDEGRRSRGTRRKLRCPRRACCLGRPAGPGSTRSSRCDPGFGAGIRSGAAPHRLLAPSGSRRPRPRRRRLRPPRSPRSPRSALARSGRVPAGRGACARRAIGLAAASARVGSELAAGAVVDGRGRSDRRAPRRRDGSNRDRAPPAPRSCAAPRRGSRRADDRDAHHGSVAARPRARDHGRGDGPDRRRDTGRGGCRDRAAGRGRAGACAPGAASTGAARCRRRKRHARTKMPT